MANHRRRRWSARTQTPYDTAGSAYTGIPLCSYIVLWSHMRYKGGFIRRSNLVVLSQFAALMKPQVCAPAEGNPAVMGLLFPSEFAVAPHGARHAICSMASPARYPCTLCQLPPSDLGGWHRPCAGNASKQSSMVVRDAGQVYAPAQPAELVAAAAGIAGTEHVLAAAALLDCHAALQTRPAYSDRDKCQPHQTCSISFVRKSPVTMDV